MKQTNKQTNKQQQQTSLKDPIFQSSLNDLLVLLVLTERHPFFFLFNLSLKDPFLGPCLHIPVPSKYQNTSYNILTSFQKMYVRFWDYHAVTKQSVLNLNSEY